MFLEEKEADCLNQKTTLDKDVRNIKILHNLSLQLIDTEETQSFYDKIMDAAITLMESDMASIQIIRQDDDDKKEKLFLLAYKGFSQTAANFWKWVDHDTKGTSCGVALKTNKPVIIPDVSKADFLGTSEDLYMFNHEGIKACQTTPLISRKGKLVGMLSTHWNKPYSPSEYELYFMDLLARQVADLIERKTIEDHLRHSEEVNRRIVESCQDCIKVLDLQGHLVSMNRSGQHSLEIDDVTPYIGKKWITFWPESEHPKIKKAFDDLFETGRGEFEGHFLTVKTKTLCWWHVVITPILGADNKPIELLAISRNITERKKYQQHLEQSIQQADAANQAKSEFLSTMSHEIRTPMNVIIGLAYILSRSKNLPPREKECVETLRTSSEHLLALINDILDIAKIENSSIQLESIPFRPFKIIQDVIKIFTVTAEQKKLSLYAWCDFDESYQCLGDPVRVQQIFSNIVNNAIKFTHHGSVTVMADIQPCDKRNSNLWKLSLSVIDTGIGMDTQTIEKIFHKFTQGDSSTSRKYGGTGLGLAISRELIKLMGGEITVTSDKGQGTHFKIILPLKIALLNQTSLPFFASQKERES